MDSLLPSIIRGDAPSIFRNLAALVSLTSLARHCPQTNEPRLKSRLETINVETFLYILCFVFGGAFNIHLKNPCDIEQLAVLFQVSRTIRAATCRIAYNFANFHAGREILGRKDALAGPDALFVPYCTLRPERIAFIRRLTLPDIHVRAFSNPECDDESYARFFKKLGLLTVEFDAGWWDKALEEPAPSKYFVKCKVKRMFVDRPHLIKWFGSEKEYKVKLRLRFPVNADVYVTAIIEKGDDVEKKEEAAKPLCAVAVLWKNAVLAALKGKDVSFRLE